MAAVGKNEPVCSCQLTWGVPVQLSAHQGAAVSSPCPPGAQLSARPGRSVLPHTPTQRHPVCWCGMRTSEKVHNTAHTRGWLRTHICTGIRSEGGLRSRCICVFVIPAPRTERGGRRCWAQALCTLSLKLLLQWILLTQVPRTWRGGSGIRCLLRRAMAFFNWFMESGFAKEDYEATSRLGLESPEDLAFASPASTRPMPSGLVLRGC